MNRKRFQFHIFLFAQHGTENLKKGLAEPCTDPLYPKPDGLKQKSIKWKKKPQIKKQKKSIIA